MGSLSLPSRSRTYNMSEEPPSRAKSSMDSRISVEFATQKHENATRTRSGSDPKFAGPTYHILPIDVLMEQFGLTDAAVGLTTEQANAGKAKWGKNEISPPTKNPFWMILGFIFGGFNGFLWFAAALCFLAWRLGALVRKIIARQQFDRNSWPVICLE